MASRLLATVVQPRKSGNEAPNTPFSSWISATTCIFSSRSSPLPSGLAIDRAQRSCRHLAGAGIHRDPPRLRRMPILDVIARAFTRDDPALTCEPRDDVPGLVRVV